MNRQDAILAAKIAGWVLLSICLLWGIDSFIQFYFINEDVLALTGHSRELVLLSISRYTFFVRLLFLLGCVVCGGIFFYYSKKVHQENCLHRQFERSFQTLMDSVSDGVVAIDGNGRIRYVNKNILAMSGMTADRVVNMLSKHLWQAVGIPEDIQGDSRLTLERNGGLMSFYITRRLIEDDEGHSCGELVVLADESRLTKMTQEIQGLKQNLERSREMAFLGTMMGQASHNLNNLLSGIISYPEILLLTIPNESPLKQPIMKIYETGMRAADLVEDLHSLARGTTGLSPKAIRLDEVVRDFFESADFQMIKKRFPGVGFYFEKDADRAVVEASPDHIQKIIKNLVLNAVFSVGENGVIRLEVTPALFNLANSPPDQLAYGDYVALSVADSGPEIRAEDLPRMYEPFYTKKKMGRDGTGLELPVVWKMVKEYGGTMRADSSREGTRVEVYLPRTDSDPEGRQTKRSIVFGRQETIIVVDDEDAQLEIATVMLKKLRYSPVTFQCGEEAIFYLRKHSADLVVLDLMMEPHISGLETYEKIISFKPHQKAIIVSGFIDDQGELEAHRLGISTILKKPYNLDGLGTAIQTELAKK